MKRRQILKLFTAVAGWMVVSGSPLALLVRRSCAALRRRLLPADTDLGTLLFENPNYPGLAQSAAYADRQVRHHGIE